MDRVLMEYAVNAAWQLPVLAAGAWLLVRVAKPSAAAQYRIWVGVLALAVLLPLMGVMTDAGARVEVARVSQVSEARPGAPSEAVASAGLVNASPIDMMAPGADAASGVADAAQVSTRSGATTPVVTTAKAMWARLRLTWRIEVSARTAEWVTGLYLLVMLLGLTRIVRARSAARRLAEDSYAEALTGNERALIAECARRMSVREPEVRVVDEADGLQGPVVVGARRPVLLCPEGFVRRLLAAGREDEARAALCHEMAHIKRRDYAANLMCEVMAVGLKWHPVTYGVERRIRGTREMACDAMAARVMESDAEYARCLVGLAERMTMGGMVEQAGAMGLLNGNALEERVMRLMEAGKTMSVRAKVVRGVAGVAAMAAAVMVAGLVHVVPARAQAANAPVIAQSTGKQTATTAVEAAAQVKPVVAVVNPRVRVRTSVHAVVKPVAAPVVRVDDVNVNVHVATAVHVVSTPVKIAEVVKPVVAVHPVIAMEPPQVQVTPEAKPAAVPQAAPVAEKMLKPVPDAAPAPEAAKPYHHEAIVSRDGKLYVWENGKERELTPAERARMERKLEEAQKKLKAEAARLNSPEFKEQMKKAQREAMEAQRKLMNGDIQRQMLREKAQMDAEMAKMNSPEFKAHMEKAKKEMADTMGRLNSPELKEQMEKAQREAMEAQKKIMSGEIQSQMAAAKAQMDAEMAKMNSPEFKEQMEKAQREAMEAQKKIMSGDIQRQMAGAQEQIQKQLDQLKAQDAKDGK